MQENINIPDSTITSALTFRNLVLMNMQQLTNFPYIENDFDALTDYELLCLVVKYLNDVITNQNEQNDSITNMYNAFLSLQTYVNNTKDTLEDAFNALDNYVRTFFENLDVQEEINNKLDDMLEQGTLQEIIYQFLQSNVAWCFDSVANMKLAENFINGSFAQTLGYYSVNDGGASLYKIRTKTLADTSDDMFLIDLYDETLVAELIIPNNTINVKAIGIKANDSTFNATTKLQAIINKNLGYKIYFPIGTYYLTNIEVPIGYHNVKIYGDGYLKNKTCFMPYTEMTGTMFIVGEADTTIENIVYGFELHNLEIKGGSEKYTMNGVDLGRTSNVKIENVGITYIDGFALRLDGCYDSIFENVEINNSGNSTYAALIYQGTTTATNATRFNNSRLEACTRYLHLKENIFQLMFNNVKFEDNVYADSTLPIVIEHNGDACFNNCVFTSKASPSNYFITFNSTYYNVITRFIGCTFQCSGTNTSGGKYISCPNQTAQDIIINGCYFYYPNTNGGINLNKATFVNNAVFPFTFNDANNTHIIDVSSNCIIKNNFFLGNSGTNKAYAIKLNGDNNVITDNKYLEFTSDHIIDGLTTHNNNTLDSFLKSFSGLTLSNGRVNALQSNVVQIPGDTTVSYIDNSWIGCEITFYGNGSNCVIDFTNIPLLYNYITSLTVAPGRTATLRKITATQWLLIASNS